MSTTNSISPALSGYSGYSFISVFSDSEQSEDEIVYTVDDSLSEVLESDDDFVFLTAREAPLTPEKHSIDLLQEHEDVPFLSLSGLTSDLQKFTIQDLNETMSIGNEEQTDVRSSLSFHNVILLSAPITPRTGQSKLRSNGNNGKTMTSKKPPTPRASPSTERCRQKCTKESASPVEVCFPFKKTSYEEAHQYITDFIANPEAKEHTSCRLAFMQALIIELGLASSMLPTSVRSARTFLKSRVFINIRDYLAVREQGYHALQHVMHPSKKSLVKSIKNKKNVMPRKQVKAAGLQVLLVQSSH